MPSKDIDIFFVFALAGYCAGLYLFFRQAIEEKQITNIRVSVLCAGVLFTTCAGIFGGYMLAALESSQGFSFRNDSVFKYGNHYLGIVLSGIAASYLYCRLHGISIWKSLLDYTAVPLFISYFFIRLGCHVSGDGC